MMNKQEIVVDTVRALSRARHGEKAGIVRAAAQAAGVSVATLQRWLKEARDVVRKTRTDAGSTRVSREAADKIAAMLYYGARHNGKRARCVESAVDVLMRAGEIDLPVEADTGAVRIPSRSTIVRALAAHGVSMAQLSRPAPHTEMRSLHPNHVWEVDASVCSLFYMENGEGNDPHVRASRAARACHSLPPEGAAPALGLPGGGRGTGQGRDESRPYEDAARFVDPSADYKNKPHNMARVERGSVVRYVVVDHCTGAFFVHYALGAESAANAAEALIRAMTCTTPGMMHGKPKIIVADQGAAHKSAAFRHLLDTLEIRLILHAPKNARATGAAEVANRIVGEHFEPDLRLFAVADVEKLNETALRWALWFQSRRPHSRHGMTRTQAWARIAPAELVEIDGALARELLLSRPVPRTVSNTLRIDWRGKQYDVSAIPDVCNGQRLPVAVNPLYPERIAVTWKDAEGMTHIHHAPPVPENDWGFCEASPVWGETFAAPPVTPNDRARERVAAAAGELREKDRARFRTDAQQMRAGEKLFGGTIAPETLYPAPEVVQMPRRGEVATPPVAVQRAVEQYSHFRAARWLAERGVALTDTVHALIDREWPEGVPETDLEELQRRAQTASGLQIVKGGER